MKAHLPCLKNNWAGFIVGLLGVFLIQGCTTPLVKVDNQTIVGECSDEDNFDGVGACSNQTYNGSATNFWHKDTDHIIQASENLNCTVAGSKKCRKTGTASSCTNAQGQPDYCYSTYTNIPNPGTCFCACDQL